MSDDAIDMRVTAAEAEMLALLRGTGSRNFCLTVTALHGAWTVKLATVAESAVSERQGASFGEAWTGAPAAGSGAAPRKFDVIEGGRV